MVSLEWNQQGSLWFVEHTSDSGSLPSTTEDVQTTESVKVAACSWAY